MVSGALTLPTTAPTVAAEMGSPSCPGTGLSVSTAQIQEVELTEALQLEAARARRWRYVWTAINGISTVVPLATLPLVDRKYWPDVVAGSITSAVSTSATVLWPLEVENADSVLLSLADRPPCERAPLLRSFFVEAARDESYRRSWPWHAVNFAVSAALGGVVAFGFGHPAGGLITGLSGFVAGEAQLLTQPVGLPEMSGVSSRLATVRMAYQFAPARKLGINLSLQW
jgi:hypothetical protein